MSRLRLSALLPNYNHGRYLPQALEAMLGQSRPPDELIALDDGSTDNSLEVLEEYARRNPRLRVVRHEVNQGILPTQRDLMALASGDYVYSAAADDFVLPGFFEGAMALAQQYPQAGVICGQVSVLGDDDQEEVIAEASRWHEALYAPPDRFLREYMDVEWPGHSLICATVFRRDALMEVGGFRQELGHWADSFAIRSIALKYGACYAPQRWACHRPLPTGHYAARRYDFRRHAGVIAATVRLMRSEEFRDRFPEAHVRRWKRASEKILFQEYILKLREPLGTKGWGLWKGRLLKRYLGLVALARYRGDLTAYLLDRG